MALSVIIYVQTRFGRVQTVVQTVLKTKVAGYKM